MAFQLPMGSRKRQSIGKSQLQRHLPTVGSREIVGEKHIYRVALVGWKWQRFSVECHARIHQRETNPRVGAWYKLAIELHVDTCCMSVAQVIAIVNHLHVVHTVRNKVAQCLIIQFARKLKRTSRDVKPIVQTRNEMQRTLAFYLFIERYARLVVHGRGVAQFLKEWGLIIKTCRKTQCKIGVKSRNDAQRHARTDDCFLIKSPMAHPDAVIKGVTCVFIFAAKAISVLCVGLYPICIELVFCPKRIDKV